MIRVGAWMRRDGGYKVIVPGAGLSVWFRYRKQVMGFALRNRLRLVRMGGDGDV